MRRTGLRNRVGQGPPSETRRRLQAVQQKFHPTPNPLEREQDIGILEPTNAEQQQKLSRMLDVLYANANSDAERNAIALYQMQLVGGTYVDQVKLDFIRRFYFWLVGRGTDADHKKTLWGRGNAAVNNPEVAAYIEAFSAKRLQYAQQLILLANRVPPTLNGYYLYFKYIVGGKLRHIEVDGNRYWDMSNDDYLDDFEMFQQVFGDPKVGYKALIAPAAAGQPKIADSASYAPTSTAVDPYPKTSAERAKWANSEGNFPGTEDERLQEKTEQVAKSLGFNAYGSGAASRQRQHVANTANQPMDEAPEVVGDDTGFNERLLQAFDRLSQSLETKEGELSAAHRAALEAKFEARLREMEQRQTAAPPPPAEATVTEAQLEAILQRLRHNVAPSTAELREPVQATAQPKTDVELNNRVHQLEKALLEQRANIADTRAAASQTASVLERTESAQLRQTVSRLIDSINNAKLGELGASLSHLKTPPSHLSTPAAEALTKALELQAAKGAEAATRAEEAQTLRAAVTDLLGLHRELVNSIAENNASRQGEEAGETTSGLRALERTEQQITRLMQKVAANVDAEHAKRAQHEEAVIAGRMQQMRQDLEAQQRNYQLRHDAALAQLKAEHSAWKGRLPPERTWENTEARLAQLDATMQQLNKRLASEWRNTQQTGPDPAAMEEIARLTAEMKQLQTERLQQQRLQEQAQQRHAHLSEQLNTMREVLKQSETERRNLQDAHRRAEQEARARAESERAKVAEAKATRAAHEQKVAEQKARFEQEKQRRREQKQEANEQIARERAAQFAREEEEATLAAEQEARERAAQFAAEEEAARKAEQKQLRKEQRAREQRAKFEQEARLKEEELRREYEAQAAAASAALEREKTRKLWESVRASSTESEATAPETSKKRAAPNRAPAVQERKQPQLREAEETVEEAVAHKHQAVQVQEEVKALKKATSNAHAEARKRFLAEEAAASSSEVEMQADPSPANTGKYVMQLKTTLEAMRDLASKEDKIDEDKFREIARQVDRVRIVDNRSGKEIRPERVATGQSTKTAEDYLHEWIDELAFALGPHKTIKVVY